MFHLGGVEHSIAYGSPALRVCCLPAIERSRCRVSLPLRYQQGGRASEVRTAAVFEHYLHDELTGQWVWCASQMNSNASTVTLICEKKILQQPQQCVL